MKTWIFREDNGPDFADFTIGKNRMEGNISGTLEVHDSDPMEGIKKFWARWGEVLSKRPISDWQGNCYQEMVEAIKKAVGK
jgi:hypothetical protein